MPKARQRLPDYVPAPAFAIPGRLNAECGSCGHAVIAGPPHIEIEGYGARPECVNCAECRHAS